MGRQVSISKLQTGDDNLDRVQEHLRQQLLPVLGNPLLSAADFRWTELAGANPTAAGTWALQFRTTGTTWTTILSVTSAGAVSLSAVSASGTTSSITQPAWIAPALLNSWVNFDVTSFQPAG